MARVEDHIVVDSVEQAQALTHGDRIRTGQVGSTAPVKEQGVSSHEATIDEEALAPRGVSGGVNQTNLDVANVHDVTGGVGDEVIGADPGGPLHPLDLLRLDMDWTGVTLEESGDPLDVVTHDRPSDVIGVVVGGKNTDDRHPVGSDPLNEVVHVPGGIDEQALTGRSVTDRVGEVHHLSGEGIADGEISAREHLAEVEAVVTSRCVRCHRSSVRLAAMSNSTNPSDTVRYGLIGSGMMGVEHLENIAHLDGAVVTAVSDPVDERRAIGAATVSSFGGEAPTLFADHRELIDSGLCDAVVIASPNMTHVDVLGDVLSSDLHVLVEKPLCTTVEDCRRVVDAAAAGPSDRVVWMGLEYRYMPPTTALLAELATGVAGSVKMVAIREHRFPFLVKVGDWNRFNRNTGGTLVEKCCHFFDLMRLVAGAEPVRVLASGAQDVNHLDERYDGEVPDILDNAYVIVEFANGVRGMLDLCMFAEASVNEQEIAVTGDQGKVEALVTQSLLRVGRRADGLHVVDERPISAERVRHVGLHHGASYLEHVDFIESVRAGRSAAVTLTDGLWSVAVGVAAHRSIDEGRPVMLDEVMANS